MKGDGAEEGETESCEACFDVVEVVAFVVEDFV